MKHINIFVCAVVIVLTLSGCSQSAKDADITIDAYAVDSSLAPYKGLTKNDIDAKTIKGKVLCGYQMWFQAVGDGAGNKWVHWSNNSEKITKDNLTFDMWPDMSEYPESEKFPVEGMKHKDGSQAYLFSSKRQAVSDLHFKWMKDYGIDGVFVQRFLCGTNNPNTFGTSGTLALARNSANKYGRVFSITYDLSGTPEDRIYDMLVSDWKFLVDKMEITKDKRFLHEGGKPALEIYGFFPDRFSAETANKIIDFFKNDPKYGVYLIGAGSGWWRSVDDPGWVKAYRRFDMMKPWNVGNFKVSKEEGYRMASTDNWKDDITEAKKAGMAYMPCVYPGFSWDNLMRTHNQLQNVGDPIKRRGGEFLWEQFVTATELKVDSIFVAMFDEVDEGTAIFKVTNDPPVDAHFATYEGKPSDWYLRLVGYGTKMLRGEVPLQKTMPEKL